MFCSKLSSCGQSKLQLALGCISDSVSRLLVLGLLLGVLCQIFHITVEFHLGFVIGIHMVGVVCFCLVDIGLLLLRRQRHLFQGRIVCLVEVIVGLVLE